MRSVIRYVNSNRLRLPGLPPRTISPSQVVNLPVAVAGMLTIAVVTTIVYPLARARSYEIGVVVVLTTLGVLPVFTFLCLRTAFIEFIIDAECITCRNGIFYPRIFVIELSRIQNVTAEWPWWQRLGGGTVIIGMGDPYRFEWRMKGGRDLNQICNILIQVVNAAWEVHGIGDMMRKNN